MRYDCAAVSPAYKIWRLKNKDINIEFLDILLRSSNMREIYRSKMQGSVDRRRSIPDEIFLQITIPLPPLEIQKDIVAVQKEVIELRGRQKILECKIQKNIQTMWNKEKSF